MPNQKKKPSKYSDPNSPAFKWWWAQKQRKTRSPEPEV